jgi:cytochrome c biogenesis protein CcmG/thiol:disulfide interchange protein DsbE
MTLHRLFLPRLTALTLLGALVAGCAATPARPVTTELPAAHVLDLRGQKTNLRQVISGRVAVVDLWATWCDACEKERPKLERLAKIYAARGLLVIALNVGEPSDVVAEYQTRHHIAYPVYLDPDFRFADALNEERVPTLLVIAPDGRIAHRSARIDDAMLRRIAELLPPDSQRTGGTQP